MMEQRVVKLETSVSEYGWHSKKTLWVFGYGSLCWRPGFNFDKAVIGHVEGFQRRFWQGNTTHRGTDEKPGRVATLIENKKSSVHGIAFALSGNEALPYLTRRECDQGDYVTYVTTFHPIVGDAFKVLVYVATPTNPQWLGEAHVSDIAEQIVECSGAKGHNVEYLLRLVQFMRLNFPEQHDQHLYTLEKAVLERICAKNLCMATLMGDGKDCIIFTLDSIKRRKTSDELIASIETFPFAASRIVHQHSEKNVLRCLN